MINLFKHLLPTGAPWSIIVNKYLRKLFVGLSVVAQAFRDYIDLVWLDLFPATTREFDRFDAQFGLTGGEGLTTALRRARIASAWTALGGQSAYYIQSVLQAAGFNVWVHEAFTRGLDPYRCGEDRAYCGNPDMVCRQSFVMRNPALVLAADNVSIPAGMGYPLTNRTPFMDYAVTPTNPAHFGRILYIGGQTFGTLADVPAERRDELERLVLKLRPAHLWVGMLVGYAGPPSFYAYNTDVESLMYGTEDIYILS